jgi:hypothetical protein
MPEVSDSSRPVAADSRLPTARIYAGLFFVTLATLMLELLLTRIFSVILWYHFAFVAVSVALFGMTLGAVIVHLMPRYFSGADLSSRLAGASALFGLTTAIVLVLMLTLRVAPPALGSSDIASLLPLYLLIAVPFTFSGIVVSVALTRFPQRVNRLYAVDLIGAAIGCSAVIALLEVLDAPSAVIAIGAAAALGAVFFSLETARAPARGTAAALVVALAVLVAVNAQTKALRVRWIKGVRARTALYETWNAFSRVAVMTRLRVPPPWHSARDHKTYAIRQLRMDIDGTAATLLTEFDGNLAPLGYLQSDISAPAHWLRPNARVLVIGVGGGRDILTALTMNQKAITGIELNGAIVRAVNGHFGDYTGHLDRNPRVRFINDEARSWIDRSNRKFDIIQCSLIDTWAATAAGAFVLSENNLYTEQAWTSILRHLSDRGIFSVTRWYFQGTPGEMLRCLSLARASLERIGVRNPRRHLAVLRFVPQDEAIYAGNGKGTILISRAPLTDPDLRTLERFARDARFDLVLSPIACKEPLFAQLLSAPRLRDFTDSFRLDVSPPTDDRPFFFNMLRLRRWASALLPGDQGPVFMNLQATAVLMRLLVVTIALAALFIIAPLGLTHWRDRYSLRSLAPALAFFCAIGLGFMLVEISQMQRLIIFLGHPIYGLSVVLFALLGASGLGSLAAGGISLGRGRGAARVGAIMAALLALLVLFGLITPVLTDAARGWPMAQRLLLAVALLVPIAFLMGAPFPLGMKLAGRAERAPTAWYWGINGAMSVVASVAAMALALAVGISATFFIGVACYAGAAAFLILLSRQSGPAG